MANKDSQGKARTRNWTFVIYPESVVSNWRDVLDDEHIQWVESPVHDKDTNPEGEIKKAHIHIL
uniref:Rep family protein n=1 Tax=Staphylococcus sp. GDX8P107P-1 TaxID=2804109 RepID=UPI001FD9DA67